MWIKNWIEHAACKGSLDKLFVKGKAQHEAKKLCAKCWVRAECLADALDNRIEFGVWGGMTEHERRMLLRNNRNVKSWRPILERARETA
jgi:WhiB family transcriptional regulator, redox-sensing transcriptional regulator